MEKSDASLNCVNYVVSFPIISTANCFAQERVLILKIPQLPVCIFKVTVHLHNTLKAVSAGSPSRGWDVAVYIFDINQPSLPTPFYSVPVSISASMTFQLYFIP